MTFTNVILQLRMFLQAAMFEKLIPGSFIGKKLRSGKIADHNGKRLKPLNK